LDPLGFGALFTRGAVDLLWPETEDPRFVLERVGLETLDGVVRDRLAGVPDVTRCGAVAAERVLVAPAPRVAETPREVVERVAEVPLTDDALVDFARVFVRESSPRVYP